MPEPGADASGDGGLRGRDLIGLGGLLAVLFFASFTSLARADVEDSETSYSPGKAQRRSDFTEWLVTCP